MSRNRILQLTLGVAVSVLFIWLVLRRLELSEIAAVLGEAEISWIIVAVGSFALGYACRIQRWRIMLSADRSNMSFGRATVPFLASIATNNVLPFRAGDVLRAFAFKEWLGIGAPVVLATLIVERILDMLSLLLILGIVLAIVVHNVPAAGGLLGVGAHALIAISVVLSIALLRPQLFESLARCITALVQGRAPRIGERVGAILDQIFAALRQQAHGPRMVLLVLWSFAAWSFEGGVFYATACAIPALTQAVGAWLAFPVSTLATLLPSTPGHAGTFDFFASHAAEIMGNPAAAATAFALLVHFILWLTATFAGGVCLGIWIICRYANPKPATESPTS